MKYSLACIAQALPSLVIDLLVSTKFMRIYKLLCQFRIRKLEVAKEWEKNVVSSGLFWRFTNIFLVHILVLENFVIRRH